MDIYEDLPLDELDERILNLARQLASGASSIASPDAGSVTYVARESAMRTLRALKRSKARRLGLPNPAPDRIRSQRVISVNDYFQR